MHSSLTHHNNHSVFYLRLFVQKILEGLLSDAPLPKNRPMSKLWKELWGKAAYSDRVSQHELDSRTRRRKAFLLRVFRVASEEIRKKKITPAEASEMMRRLSNCLNFNLKCNKTDSVEHLSWGPIVKAFSRPII